MNRMIAALLAAVMAAAPVAAQPDPSTSPEPAPVTYALIQLSLQPGRIATGEFRKRTEAIRSCPEAVKLAGELGAEVVRNARVTPDRLPPRLAALLVDLPVGRATPVFTGSGNTVRVLVLCHRG